LPPSPASARQPTNPAPARTKITAACACSCLMSATQSRTSWIATPSPTPWKSRFAKYGGIASGFRSLAPFVSLQPRHKAPSRSPRGRPRRPGQRVDWTDSRSVTPAHGWWRMFLGDFEASKDRNLYSGQDQSEYDGRSKFAAND